MHILLGQIRNGDQYQNCTRKYNINIAQKPTDIQIPNRNKSINKSRCHVFPWMTVGSLHLLLSFFKLTGRSDSSWIRCHPELPTRNRNRYSCTDFTKDKQANKGMNETSGKAAALEYLTQTCMTLIAGGGGGKSSFLTVHLHPVTAALLKWITGAADKTLQLRAPNTNHAQIFVGKFSYLWQQFNLVYASSVGQPCFVLHILLLEDWEKACWSTLWLMWSFCP